MKRSILSLTTVAAAALSLTSCLQNETTIHLNKDGSGTVVEETTFGAQTIAMLEQMSSIGGEQKDPLADMFSEEKAKKRAAKLGEGVTVEKTEAVDKNGNKGGRATYHFTDINKLKVSTSDSMQDMSPMGEQAQVEAKGKPIVFTYTGGKLTIAMPEFDKADAPAPEAPADQPEPGEQEMAMMKQMLSDMKMSLKVVIEPGIEETNATNRDGKTITLMEMDMGKVIENPDMMKKLRTMNQQDPAAAMEQMKGIPGIKFEAQKEVTVQVD
jgi:hypothetical protein